MLIEQITLKNILSFRDETIPLLPLNILIGENAVGKSNLIEAIGLLKAEPTDFYAAILRGGGVRYWLWLGDKSAAKKGTIACQIGYEGPLNYEIVIAEDASTLLIANEALFGDITKPAHFVRQGDKVTIGSQEGKLPTTDSVLARFKSPTDSTPTTWLGRQFERIRIFREFQTGPRASSRLGVSSSVEKDFLSDDGGNLALMLLEMDFFNLHGRISAYLKRFCERFDDFKIRLDGQIARTYLNEQGLLEPLPSVRLSDGTLKFLCLLAVLLHPDPPPLVCIEEPEVGLHPDAIQIVAQALVDASERMQLIVTTHSEALVDAFSASPERVLVLERDFNNGTRCSRLNSDRLSEWLQRYSLGRLWRKGVLGGNRW